MSDPIEYYLLNPKGAGVHRILLIEDSPEYQSLVREALRRNDIEIYVAATADEALQIVKLQSPNLILMDVGLPDSDGFKLFVELKEHRISAPVIFLTGEAGIPEKVKAFHLGAEDYIVKPFDPFEFRARIESKLDRSPESVLIRADLKIDIFLQKAFIVASEEETDLQLTPAEFKILSYLAWHQGKTFTTKEILEAIWEGVHVIERNVSTHIYGLRRKLGSRSTYVQSWGGKGGYCFSIKPLGHDGSPANTPS